MKTKLNSDILCQLWPTPCLLGPQREKGPLIVVWKGPSETLLRLVVKVSEDLGGEAVCVVLILGVVYDAEK